MKSFCRYTGIILQKDNILDSLITKRRKLIAASEHQIFHKSYDVFEIVHIATNKTPEKMTANQRRLLFTAMLKHTRLVSIDWPLNESTIPTGKILQLYPQLVSVMVRIASHYNEWKMILSAMPKLQIRSDNWESVNIGGFIIELLERTQILLLPLGLKTKKKSYLELLDDEIDLERELKNQLLKLRNDKKKYAFNINVGKFVLAELDKNLRKAGKYLTQEQKDKALYIFSTPKEKIKYGPEPIEKIRELIIMYVEVTIEPADTILRNYVMLTIGYLDNCLDFCNSLAGLFGGITREVPAKLPKASPVQYSTTVVVEDSNPFTNITVSIPPKNTNLTESAKSNSLLASILKKREVTNES